MSGGPHGCCWGIAGVAAGSRSRLPPPTPTRRPTPAPSALTRPPRQVERLREDAAFWKRELDSAIAERNQWQQRGVTADRDVAILKRELMSTKQEYAELRRAVAKAFPDLAASVRSSAEAGSQAAAGSAESAVARLAHHKEMYAKLYEAAKGLQAQLGASKAQAREMEARSGLLTERVEALRQENDLLRHQNQLLRASEATFEREASLVRACGSPS